MIQYKNLSSIPDTEEGRTLLAAVAILTSIEKKDIQNNLWGGNVHPDDALKRVVELANKIFYEQEWKSEQILKERDLKLNKIIE